MKKQRKNETRKQLEAKVEAIRILTTNEGERVVGGNAACPYHSSPDKN